MRDMYRHYTVEHRSHAAEHNVAQEGGVCPRANCKKTFTRYDNLVKHQRKYEHWGEQ